MSNGRQQGRVKWFSSSKGYGFALGQVDGVNKDIFLHVNCLPEGVDKLPDGQNISFIVEQTRKGPRATNVRLET